LKAIFIVCLISIIGCGSTVDTTSVTENDNAPAIDFNEKNGWASTYEVLIDPNFTQTEIASITQAVLTWEAAVPVQMSIWTAVCTGSVPGQICVHYWPDYLDGGPSDNTIDFATGSGLLGYTWWDNNHADIIMYDWYIDGGWTFNAPNDGGVIGGNQLFFMAVLHELGHAQGLIHHVGEYIMNPDLPSGPNTLTANDADQWFTLRGLPSIPDDAGLTY
jgi:hypothetical protein